jgi:hypothetical protein
MTIHSLHDLHVLTPFQKTTIRKGEIMRETAWRDNRGREFERVGKPPTWVLKSPRSVQQPRNTAASQPQPQQTITHIVTPAVDGEQQWVAMIVLWCLVSLFALMWLCVGVFVGYVWRRYHAEATLSPSTFPSELSLEG